MAANKWPKWVAGISGVLSFTGFLYMIEKGDLAASASSAEAQAWNGPVRQDAAMREFYAMERLPEGLRGEIFLHEPESFKRMLEWTDEQKSERERLLESLSWDTEPDAEITLPAPAYTEDRVAQTRPRSSAKTRRS